MLESWPRPCTKITGPVLHSAARVFTGRDRLVAKQQSRLATSQIRCRPPGMRTIGQSSVAAVPLSSIGPGRALEMDLANENSLTPFERLSPDVVIAAVEAAGERCDGRVLALGSYENRVYQVGREESDPVVVKFYRPRRWSDAAIREEHAFALELAAAEVPVVAPLVVRGETLLEHEGFRYAIYPRRGGHWPELGNKDDRVWMGRFIGRMHAVGRTRTFEHRPRLSVASHVAQARDTVLESGFLPDYLVARYNDTTQEILERLNGSLAPDLERSRLRI